jgi:hypothetical protein
MGKGARRISISATDAAPLYYTRLNDSGTAFEPERNLITSAPGLDGGSSVAVDLHGHVYVVWHAPLKGNTNGDAGRAVFVARSSDDGKTFQPEVPAISKPTGGCACCGLRAFADKQGAVYVLFRAATEGTHRDETLLIARHAGADFQIASSHPWRLSTCPMSSASLSEADGGALAAWETAGQVYFSRVNPNTLNVSKPISPPGGTGRQHPTIAENRRGEVLLAWAEGTGWDKGGSVAWQVYDRAGEATPERGRDANLPVWSLPTSFAASNGDFVLMY